MLQVDKNIAPYFLPFVHIVETIALQFGANCEVALHDLRKPQASLVALSGQITKRSVGAPITNYVLNLLYEHGDRVETSYHYFSSTADGKKLKSSTTFLRNAEEEVIGCICINFCIDNYVKFANVLEEICSAAETSAEKGQEHYSSDITSMVDNILEEVLGQKKYKILEMDRNDKLAIVRELEQRGLFLVKGSVELVAGKLDISKYTLYSYIDEIKGSVN